jgi:uncharacterized protein YpmS
VVVEQFMPTVVDVENIRLDIESLGVSDLTISCQRIMGWLEVGPVLRMIPRSVLRMPQT